MLDRNGQITTNKKGYSFSELKYDKNYQETGIKYSDMNQSPCINIQLGCSRIVTGYDGFGNPIEKRFYGTDGESIENKLCKCASIKFHWDDMNFPTKSELYDIEGKKVE
jgi:hypothetical protein